MFINTEHRLNEALQQQLQAGEVVQESAYGLHSVSRTTAKIMWLLAIILVILGFFTAMLSWIGLAILIACWNTKIFLVLTDRRLLLIELSNRGLRVTGSKSFAIDRISAVDFTPGKWNELQLHADDQWIRCVFSSFVVNFVNNGKRVENIAQQLQELPAVRLMERFDGKNNVASSFVTVETEPAKPVLKSSSSKKWLIATCLVLLMPVFMVVSFFMICFGIGVSEGLKAHQAEQQAQIAIENQDFAMAEQQLRTFIATTYKENQVSGYQQLAEMWIKTNQLKKAEAVYREGIAKLESEDVSVLEQGLLNVKAKLNAQEASIE